MRDQEGDHVAPRLVMASEGPWRNPGPVYRIQPSHFQQHLRDQRQNRQGACARLGDGGGAII